MSKPQEHLIVWSKQLLEQLVKELKENNLLQDNTVDDQLQSIINKIMQEKEKFLETVFQKKE